MGVDEAQTKATIYDASGHKKCRTRFTFSRPTPENVASTLFDKVVGIGGELIQQAKLTFNHGNDVLFI